MNRNKLKNLLLFTLALAVVLQGVLPYSNILFNGYSFHNANIGLTYCKQKEECRHEIGHLMDEDLGYVSRTSSFHYALIRHLIFSFKYGMTDDYTRAILGKAGILSYSENYKPYMPAAGSSPQEELYADIYSISDGDINKIPVTLRSLYSDDSKYEVAYNELVENKIYISNQGVITMKEMLNNVWNKVVENKELAIRVGCAVVGAAIGSAVTVAVMNAKADSYFIEEIGSMDQVSE